MKLKIKKLTPDAAVPQYATDGSGCFDLRCTQGGTAFAHAAHAFHTGLAFEVPPGYVLMVYSRSGHGFKNGLRLSNAVGILDSDYRGELMVKLHNDTATAFSFEPGDRIAQAMLVAAPSVTFEVVDELGDTARGAGGFGSSGVK